MTIVTVFDPPRDNDSPADFTRKAFGVMRSLKDFAEELDGLKDDYNGELQTLAEAVETAVSTTIPELLSQIDEAVAQTAAGAAIAAKIGAEAARDSSFSNAKGASAIVDARALVADEETFIVYQPGAATYRAYRRTSSATEVLLGEYPSKAFVDKAVAQPVTALRTGDYTLLSAAQATSLFAESSGFADFSRAFDAGTDFTVGTWIDGIAVRLQVSTAVEVVRVKLWARALTDTATSGAGPGQAGDVLLETVDCTPESLGIVPGAAVAQLAFLPLTRRIAEEVSYLVELDARDTSDARAPLGVMWGTTSGQSQRRRGYYRATVGAATWSSIGSTTTLAINICTAELASAKATTDRTKVLEQKMNSLGHPLVAVYKTVAWRYGDAAFTTSNGSYAHAIGFVGGVDAPVGAEFSGVRVPLMLPAGADAVTVRLWSRPVAAAWETQPVGDPKDTLIAQVSTTPSALGVTTGAADFKDAVFLVGQQKVAASTIYFVELEAMQSGVRVRSAVRYLNSTGLTTDQYRKFWRSGAASSWSAGVASNTWVYAFDLVAEGFAARTVPSVSDSITAATATVTGSTVTVDFEAARLGVAQRIQVSRTIAAPAGGTEPGEALTLTPALGAAVLWWYMSNRTAHADLRNVVVKDATTLAVLTKNVDYWAIEELGCFSLPGTAPGSRSVVVSYDWGRQRYDQVNYNPATGVVAVTAGTERERDAAEFIPATPAGALPLFHIHVRAGGNVAIPVWDVTDGVRADRLAEIEKDLARNRRLLRNVRRKLMAGQPVTIMSYGDSNFAQMGGAYNMAAVRTAANTVYHDRTKDINGLLREPAYGADVLASIQTYDTGDGAGAVHTRFGFCWEIVRALQSAYESEVTYKNRSIPGTNSTNAQNQGLDTVRLSAATADPADVVLVGFAANELGQSYTQANVASICQAFLAAGAVPIVTGCGRPNALDFHSQHTLARWHSTQRQLRAAALSVGVPYFCFETIYADGELGVLGLSQYDVCAGTKDLHPGIREHRIIGERLAEAFL